MDVEGIEDDIFDRNIDQLDVRETPRWELSEEEESGGSDVDTLVNQQNASRKNPMMKLQNRKAQLPMPSSAPPAKHGASALTSSPSTCPKVSLPQGAPNERVMNMPPKMGPSGKASGLVSGKVPSVGGTVKSNMKSPSLYRHQNIDALVKKVYQGESDTVKDFASTERAKEKKQASPHLTSRTNKLPKGVKNASELPPWQDDDVDSIKDFSGTDRVKEEKYMERTDEVIYQRAADEHIRRPPMWHDEEVDSVRDFGRISGKQEFPSGTTSQQISRLPSDENICLSPPWNEEDDGLVRDFSPLNDTQEKSSYSINKMVNEQRIGGVPPWQEENRDSTRDYAAQYLKRGTLTSENSRRPSSENIYLTPPWMEDDRDSCANSSDPSASAQITLDEQRAIHDEVRNAGIAEAEQRAKALRDENGQEGKEPGPQQPGQDSGFSSEQDQHAQQAQGSAGLALTAEATLEQEEKQNTAEETQRACADNQPAQPFSILQPGNQVKPVEPVNPVLPKPVSQAHFERAQEQPAPNLPLRQTNAREGVLAYKSTPLDVTQNLVGIRGAIPQNQQLFYPGEVRQTERSISRHSSLEAICYSPHDAVDGLETSSVMSFASTAATHHDLDTRIDMVQSLLSMLGTHDKDDMSRTLLAMSNSRDSCAAMRQSGCLPLLIDLLHGHDFVDGNARRESRARAGLALHNIVYSNAEDRRGRREIRVLRLLEIVRAHCDVIQYKGMPVHPCAERWYPPLRDYGPGPAVAALMKLSFEEDHRNAICELGGLQAIAELIEIDERVNGQCKDFYSISLRKYAGMTLTNLTFGNTKNKTLLCSFPGSLQALISQLTSLKEEVVQVSASVLRNLSWRAEESCRNALREAGAIKALLVAAQSVESEAALRTTLSALWNLSAHCSENKAELCTLPSALKFLVKCLNYCSPAGNLSVVESSGGIIRNLSSHIAVRPEYRQTLRENNCFHTLLTHLRSPSLRIVSNACGALWNLSARCVEDQQLLWELGAVSLLKSLVNSKHKAICTASGAALRNLMAVKPISITDNESVSSRVSRRYRSMPASSRSAEAQARLKSQVRLKAVHSPKTQSPRTQSPTQTKADTDPAVTKTTDSAASLDHGLSSLSSTKAAGKEVEPSPTLMRSRSDMGQRTLAGRQRRAKARGGDTSSVGSGTSLERAHHFPKWSDSVDSLAKQRRQAKNPGSSGRRHVDSNNSPRMSTRGAREACGDSKSTTHGSAVIQLVSDKYPLQVSVKPPKRSADPTRENVGAEELIRMRSRLYCSNMAARQNEASSVASPAASRRINQWTRGSAAAETFEMVQLGAQERQDRGAMRRGKTEQPGGAIRVPIDSTATSPGSSRSRRRHTSKFKSYRDSESEPEADVDSEDERHLFKPRRCKKAESNNAWVQSTAERPDDADSIASSNCSCDETNNVWIRRSSSHSAQARSSNSGPTQERPSTLKSRRDSTDSSPSSPNVLRMFKSSSGRESKNSGASKSVKVTSL